MSGTTVSSGVVLPVAVIEVIITAAGFMFFGMLTKNSFVYFADEKTLQKNDQEAVTRLGCLSPVHGFAVSYFVFYIFFSIANLFATSALLPHLDAASCTLTFILGSFAFVGAKGSQYGFFTTRMEYVFRDTAFQVSDWTMTKLKMVIAFYFIGSTIVYTLVALRDSGRIMVVMTGNYKVCSTVTSEFDILITIVSLIYISCDTVVMVSVVYGFVSRLLQMAKISPNDVAMAKSLKIAYRSFVLYLVSIVSSFVMISFIIVYPHDLQSSFLPHVDNFLNGVAMFAVFSFADWLYNSTCIYCHPVVACVMLACCGCCNPDLKKTVGEFGKYKPDEMNKKSTELNLVATTTNSYPPSPRGFSDSGTSGTVADGPNRLISASVSPEPTVSL